MVASASLLRVAITHGFAAMPAVAAVTAVPCLAYHGGLLPIAHADAATFQGDIGEFFAGQAEGLIDESPVREPSLDKAPSWQSPTPFGRIFGVLHYRNIGSVAGKNIALSYAFSFNAYMLQLLNHETEALHAEQEGRIPDAPPPAPPLLPPLYVGLFYTSRELVAQVVRRLYEWRTVEALGPRRAEPFLRDHKLWIRDVLSLKLRREPLGRRFYSYAFATLHGQALYYAADCTVSIALHMYSSTRPNMRHLGAKQKTYHVAKGAALHVVRCIVTLLAVSVGAAAAALVDPSWGTALGTLATDYSVTLGSSHLLHAALQV